MKAYAQQSRPSTAERDRLIAEHVDAARRIALRVARRCPDWISPDDLTSAALLGLAEAAERYDSQRPEPFMVFAEKRIKGAIMDELRRGDIMPRRVRQMARKVGATIQELERTLGGPPDDEAVAASLGVTVEHYREELEQLIHVTVGALDHLEHEPTAGEATSPARQAEKRELLRQVRSALEGLDQRELLILSLYYNEELTYLEIGQVLGVTTSRVCQLHGRAVARLRAQLEGGRAQGRARGGRAAAAEEVAHG